MRSSARSAALAWLTNLCFAVSLFAQSLPTTGGQTDDRGIYRVFGISAGRYKVAAGRGEEG